MSRGETGEFALIFRDRWMSIVKKMKIKEERGRQTRERGICKGVGGR